MARESASIVTQIGREETPGTPSSGYATLCALDVSVSPELDVKTYRAAGKRVPTTSVLNKKMGKGRFEGGVSYNELALILANLIGGDQPVAVGTGGFGWTFTPNSTGPDTPIIFTARRGDTEAAQIYSYLHSQSLQMTINRDSVEMSGDMAAYAPDNAGALTTLTDEIQALSKSGTVSGGTFTLTYSSQTTANIAWNATAAAVQAALEALSNIAPGDVFVTGGPLPSKRLHIRFAGTLAGTNVSAITVDNTNLTGGGSLGISTLLAGGAEVPQLTESPMSGNEINLYVDTSSGGLGGTQIGCPLEVRINLPERFKQKWCLNRSNTSFTEPVGIATEPMVEFDLEFNSAARALYDAVVTNNLPLRFIRVGALGANIGSGADYTMNWDFAASINMAKELKDADGVYGYTFGWNIKHSSAWGKAMTAYIVNTLPFI